MDAVYGSGRPGNYLIPNLKLFRFTRAIFFFIARVILTSAESDVHVYIGCNARFPKTGFLVINCVKCFPISSGFIPVVFCVECDYTVYRF